MSTSRFLLTITACLALAPFVQASQERTLGPTLQQRLDKLAETLEAARVDAHIPGMSIAIVKDDEVVWARGFGLADVATERAADESTIYAIGSSTKAFTATLIGSLVDEGKMTWDDPVTKTLPFFDLQVRSDDEDAECLLRDLLSHRHGFTRMGILWFGGGASRDEVLHTAAGAEPWDDFRANFHYCNVTFLAAGQAAGVAAGSTWDELMVERILGPLKMTSSTLTRAEAQMDPRLALGYEWDEVDERFEQQTMVDLSNIGPAGSVNSNVVDMAQWLRLQLANGEVDGQRVISSARLYETWEPQIEIGGGLSYGLGWMLQEYDGRKVVEHGGNIAGFSAQVALIPEENLGYVLLMNVSAAPLQQASLKLVFDGLLKEWADPEASDEAGQEIDFDDYTGIYVANFATFQDEEFEVLIEGDRLALDIPSQRTFDLEEPNEDGRWVFAMTDQIEISFQRDEHGAVVSLKLYQGGFAFEIPRKGVEFAPDVPPEQLGKYVGTYVRAEGGKRVKILISRGRLAIDNRGALLAFETPDDKGHAALRARPEQGATFKTDAEGNVDSFIYHGNAGEQLFTRLAEAPAADVPTLDEILALRGTDARIAAIKAAGGTRITGKVWVAQAGVHGTLTIQTDGTERSASHMDFGTFGSVDITVDGERAWSYDSMRGLRALKGDKLTQAFLENPGAVTGDWDEYFDSVEVIRNDTLNDRAVHVVRLRSGSLPAHTYWVDAEHGDVVRKKQVSIEGPMRIPVTVDYSEFEVIGGIRTAQHIEIENPASGKMVLTIEAIETGLELGDDVFTREVPGADMEEAAPKPAKNAAAVDAHFPVSSALAEGVSPESLATLDELIQGFVDDGEIVGAELLVIKNGKSILHESYGWRDREAQVAMENGSVFCVRSMTKPLIGTAILMLSDDKVIKLRDRVGKYLPSFDVDSTRDITIQQLLSHTSGLPMSFIMSAKLKEIDGIQGVAELGAGCKLEFEPGTAFNYSDQGTDTLTALIEVVTGAPAEDFVRARILEPLGMEDSACVMTEDSPLRARGCCKYAGTTGEWTRFWSPADPPLFPFFLGSQGLYSTLDDYARFMELWQRKGRAGKERLLRGLSVRKALTPGLYSLGASTGLPGLQSDYGFLMQLWTDAGDDGDKRDVVAFGHTGSDGTHAWVFPKQKAMVLYFTQSRGTLTGMRVEEVLGDLLLGVPFDPNQAAPPFEEYLGYYREDRANDLYRAIIRDGDDMALEILGKAIVPLTYVGEDRWKFRPKPSVVLEFDRSEDGTVTGYHIGDHQEFRFEPSADLPGADEVAERVASTHRLDLLESVGPLRTKGAIEIPKVGVEGEVTVLLAWPDRYRYDSVAQGQMERVAYDGTRLWHIATDKPIAEIEGNRAELLRGDNPFARFGDWRKTYSSLRVIQRLERGGKTVLVVRGGDTSAPAPSFYVDQETGRLIRVDSMTYIPTLGRIGQKVSFGDFRDIEGMLLPFRTEAELANPMIGKIITRVSEFELGVDVPEGTFELRD